MIKPHMQPKTESNTPTLSQVMDAVLQNLMSNFNADLFTETHRFRGAVLDEVIPHHAKKVRFLLMLAICDMKAYTRLGTLSINELVEEMLADYEINREAATATIRAIAKLHYPDLPDEPAPPKPPETNWQPTNPFVSHAKMQKLVQDPKPTPTTPAPEPTPEPATEATETDPFELETPQPPPEPTSATPTEQPIPDIAPTATPDAEAFFAIPKKDQPTTKSVATLYQAHTTEDKKTTQVPDTTPIPEPTRTKQTLKAPEPAPTPQPTPAPEPPKPFAPTHRVGELIYFGQFKWRILKINPDNTALIVSERILSKMGYHNRKVGITWEGSDMRKYLNGAFLSKFSPTEQRNILALELENKFNEKYFTQGGLSTIDKVFLLSLEEVKAYLPTEVDRIARHDGQTTWWWLRSPGMHPDHTAYIYASGGISLDGETSVYTYENNGMHFVGYRVGGVRPAMVISLETVTRV